MGLLNLEANKVSSDVRNYSMFIYGTAKIGKSTFVHDLYGKDVLFLATENRFKHLSGAYIQKINTWANFKSTLSELANPKVKEKWSVVCIDTIDNLYKMCDKYVAQMFGESTCGEKLVPFGKDWVKLQKEWEDSLQMIEKLGYTPCFVSHATTKMLKIPADTVLNVDEVGNSLELVEEEVEENGVKIKKAYYEFEKYYPNLRDKIFAPLNNMCDNILFMGETVNTNGESKRVIHLRETMSYVAGCSFPNVQPTIELSVDAFQEAMDNAINGYDKEDLTDEKPEMFHEEEKSFDELMKEVAELGKQVGQKCGRDKLVKIIERTLGEGKKVSECNEEQKELIEVVINDLKKEL